MKILHLLYSGLGGHGNVFFSLLQADKKKEFNYEAVFNGVEDIRQEYIERCKEMNIPYTFIKKQPGKHFSFYYQLFKAIKKVKPEVIFLHGSMAVLAAFAAGFLSGNKPKIIVRETQAMHMKTNPDKIALNIAMLLADYIVFLSKGYQQDVKKKIGSFYRSKKVNIIPNGIDLDFFCPAIKQENNTTVLGMVSRLVNIKDHITLFGAIRLMKNNYPSFNVKLLIAGDGTYRTALEKKVDELNLRDIVFFTGMLNEKDLPRFLQSLDIYIHASLGETMSTAIMQAMACGLPIIASDVDGINNMITDNKTGLLVSVKNEEKLADAIYNLACNTVLQKTLAANALQYAKEKLSNERMYNNYKQLFVAARV